MDLKKTLQQTLWVSIKGLVLNMILILVTEVCVYSWFCEVCIPAQRAILPLLYQGRSGKGKEATLQLVWRVIF